MKRLETKHKIWLAFTAGWLACYFSAISYLFALLVQFGDWASEFKDSYNPEHRTFLQKILPGGN